MAWNDRAYKRARRAGQAIAALTPVAERMPLIVPPEFLSDDPLETAGGRQSPPWPVPVG